jgi:phage baseplate assembly protein W
LIALVCDWGGDLSVGPDGDIAAIPVQAEINQRIIRRLLTNPGDYIWHTDYGAGLGQYVGEPYSPGLVQSTIMAQLQNESLVATTPAPVVQALPPTWETFSTASVTINFQVAGTQQPASLALNLGG